MRLYAALTQISQAIVRRRTRDDLFEGVCNILVQSAGFRMVWIGVHDPSTQRLVPRSEAGGSGDYVDSISVYVDERPEGLGPSGIAFRENRPYVCNDVFGDNATAPWRAQLEHHGILSSAAIPIHRDGEPYGVLNVYAAEVGVFRDVEMSLLRQAAADISFALGELAHAEERRRVDHDLQTLAAIVESTDDAIVSQTLDGVITSWNFAAGRLFGYEADEVIGRPINLLVPPDRPEEDLAIVRRIAAGEHVQHFETLRVHRDGKAFPVSITYSPIFAPDPGADGAFEIEGVSKIVRDISERKHAEAVAEREWRFASGLIEAMPGIIYLYSQEGRFLRWNLDFERVSGYSATEIAGMHPLDFFVGEEKALLEARIAEVFAKGESSVEASFVAKDGTATSYYLTGKRILLDGETCLVGVGVDVAQRRQAERALRELNENLERMVAERTLELESARERAEAADRLKSAFLATMSHELRTPLNAILGFTGIVLQGLAGPLTPTQTKQLGVVQSSGRHLLDLINDILDISKIEAGQIEVHCAPFDLRATIQRVSSTVAPLAEKKGLALRVIVPPLLPAMNSDRRRVEQILLNLLSNAIKFTDRGEVTLTVEVADDEGAPEAERPRQVARFRIGDTGIGIDPTDLPKLFQPFRQIDAGLERQHEGTGLGLAISRRLAILLGGTIEVESARNRGSVFTAVLPHLRGAATRGAS